MGKQGPETRLLKKMRDAGHAKYGERLVVIKYHGSAFGEAGVSDLLCCLDGVFVAIEVKAPESYGGSVDRAVQSGASVKQLAFGRRIMTAGGIFAVVASVEGFLETLEAAAFQADPLGEGETPICTCTERGGCEWNTDDGCLHCRSVSIDVPCPNLD